MVQTVASAYLVGLERSRRGPELDLRLVVWAVPQDHIPHCLDRHDASCALLVSIRRVLPLSAFCVQQAVIQSLTARETASSARPANFLPVLDKIVQQLAWIAGLDRSQTVPGFLYVSFVILVYSQLALGLQRNLALSASLANFPYLPERWFVSLAVLVTIPLKRAKIAA